MVTADLGKGQARADDAVIPLAVAQIPDTIAWPLPPRLAVGGPAAVTSLLRASGLALPAMAVAGRCSCARLPAPPRCPRRTPRWATAAGHWTLIAAALAGVVALALACIGRRRAGASPSPGRSRDPQ